MRRKAGSTRPSPQIRDLEDEVGTPLFTRGAKGVALTPAGRVFLDHARVMLAQADAAVQSARRATHPVRPSFRLGFMIGHDSSWLPETLQLLRDELPHMHVMISTQNSPQLAAALSQSMLDIAFLRREDGLPGLEFRHLVDEQLEVFLARDHPLAARRS